MNEKTETNSHSLPASSVIGKEVKGTKRVAQHRLYGNPRISQVPLRVPANAPIPMLKEDDPPHMQPQSAMVAHAQVFRLKNDTELKAYNKIIQYIGERKAEISAEERHWSDEDQNFVIFLRWCELFLDVPTRGIGAPGEMA